MKARKADINQYTIECMSVQMFGLDHCKNCDLANTSHCGGKWIRETGKNRKGFAVPIGEET